DFARAHYNLATALHTKGKVDEAVSCYREAIHLQPGYADAHFDLGLALERKGRVDEAIASYREAIRLNPDYAEAHCNLGGMLLRQGRFEEGLAVRRRGHVLGSKRPGWRYPSARWVQEAEQLVRLDERLSAVLRGEGQPSGAAERLAFAQLCQQ